MESQQTDILGTLANNLKCSICFEIFIDPATSSCGKHNYCLPCLKDKIKNCPVCREEFHKDYRPRKNTTLCNIVNIVSRTTWEDIVNNGNLPSSVKNPEVDASEHNLQTLKRKLTHLAAEVKMLDDILSKKCKTKKRSEDVASASNEVVMLGTGFENLTEGKNAPQYVPSESPEQIHGMTNSLRPALECLNNALCHLQRLDVPSQDVDTGQNVGETSTVEQNAEQAPVDPVTRLQLEGGSSESQTESQGVSMELEAEAEEAGPSAALSDCLERLSFSPQLAHKDLTFSENNSRVQVRRRSLGRPSSSGAHRFDISQVMADQEFGSGVHYWEVDTSQSTGWAVGVAYPNLSREEKLGRTSSSWCLEWSSSKLCFWHNNCSENIKHECPIRVRIMLDMEAGSLAFYSTLDNLILLHSVEVQFTAPVRPVFWLYGLKPGNSLALIVPVV